MSENAMPAKPSLRWARGLVGAYLVLSCLTVAALAVLSALEPAQVSPQAWVRGVIVAATSVLTLLFANGAVKGSPRALLRLRIVLAVLVVAVAGVLFFLSLPGWMVVEQTGCGVLLLAAAVAAFSAK